MAATPSRGEVLSLFRSLLRTARGFSDYNIREYTKCRTSIPSTPLNLKASWNSTTLLYQKNCLKFCHRFL
ncbi:unnamed protein product [Coffea canephora]|uniref:DH200=94 genomic scaffold, scaffold_164 n=1 Tax=Coffea canephora TaxID=49390 RepID=A0A068VCU0_COFCA|nr:unnamed protein product [Coffea canephora]